MSWALSAEAERGKKKQSRLRKPIPDRGGARRPAGWNGVRMNRGRDREQEGGPQGPEFTAKRENSQKMVWSGPLPPSLATTELSEQRHLE